MAFLRKALITIGTIAISGSVAEVVTNSVCSEEDALRKREVIHAGAFFTTVGVISVAVSKCNLWK